MFVHETTQTFVCVLNTKRPSQRRNDAEAFVWRQMTKVVVQQWNKKLREFRKKNPFSIWMEEEVFRETKTRSNANVDVETSGSTEMMQTKGNPEEKAQRSRREGYNSSSGS